MILCALCVSALKSQHSGGIDAEINAAGIVNKSDRDAVMDKMAESGCTVKEAVESFKSGAPIQPGAYQIGYSMELHEFPDGGFEQMKADMKRAYNYAPLDGNGNADKNRPLLPAPHVHHTIVFPDGKALACGSKGKLRENIESVAGKVKELCGAAHELQANIVGCCLSQSVKLTGLFGNKLLIKLIAHRITSFPFHRRRLPALQVLSP